jgi:hypothetical protein
MISWHVKDGCARGCCRTPQAPKRLSVAISAALGSGATAPMRADTGSLFNSTD